MYAYAGTLKRPISAKRLLKKLLREALIWLVTTVVVTNVGEQKAIDYIDTGLAAYIGWGIGTTTAAEGDTGLETASAESRVLATKTQPSADTLQMVSTITCATAAKAITEAVVMDASSSGNCIMRATFSADNVDVGDAIEFTFQLQAT